MRFLLLFVHLVADSSSVASGPTRARLAGEGTMSGLLKGTHSELIRSRGEGGGGHVRAADDRVLRGAYRRDCNAPSLSGVTHTFQYHGFQSRPNHNPVSSPNSKFFHLLMVTYIWAVKVEAVHSFETSGSIPVLGRSSVE